MTTHISTTTSRDISETLTQWLRKSSGLILLGVGVALGTLLGLTLAGPSIVIDEKVSYSDLLTAASAILIALFIGYLLDRRSRHGRVEKERAMSTVEQIFDLLAESRSKTVSYSSGRADIGELTQAFKALSSGIAELRSQLDIFEIETAKTMDTVETALHDYREAVTGGTLDEEDRRAVQARGTLEQRTLKLSLEKLFRTINRA